MLLRCRLTVGPWSLKPQIQVQILAPQNETLYAPSGGYRLSGYEPQVRMFNSFTGYSSFGRVAQR